MTTQPVDLAAWLRAAADSIEAFPLPGEVPGSLEGFVLEHGRAYESAPFSEDERRIVTNAISAYRALHRTFEPRQCFANSQGLVANDPAKKLVYIEGFAWTYSLQPALHGWASINGKVIDVTLPATNLRETKLIEPVQILGEFKGRSYLGVPFLRSYVERRRMVTGGHGTLLDDEEHDYPLLRLGPMGAVSRRVK